ncbi:MAG: hypothetical protein Q7S30_01350 [Candidatus Omnitrophota bacterium]|nr:hypothetical protein [Candidatus Omnitrophota bacterium]
MITLNFAMITMMIGSSMLPMHTQNIHAPMMNPAAQVEIIHNEEIASPAIEKEEVANSVDTTPSSINSDKTYEQCMKEAFEKVYDEVNRLLDQIPEQSSEQFQLQRTM